MDPIYLYLILFTPFFPIVLSFDKRVRYFSSWKWALLASVIVAIPFLIWDEYFTQTLVWGFTEKYLVGVNLGHLPIEEVSFFFVVPFACTFIYACVKYYFRNANLATFNYTFFIIFTGYCAFVYAQNMTGVYTVSSVGIGILVLLFIVRNKEKYKFIPMAFLLSMIPFLLVNGILTGTFLSEPIVWYNSSQFSQVRILTIPVEDAIYGFSLIVLNIILYEAFLKRGLKP